MHTIGLAGARVKIGLANLAYNIKRLVWLSGKARPSVAEGSRAGGAEQTCPPLLGAAASSPLDNPAGTSPAPTSSAAINNFPEVSSFWRWTAWPDICRRERLFFWILALRTEIRHRLDSFPQALKNKYIPRRNAISFIFFIYPLNVTNHDLVKMIVIYKIRKYSYLI
jgi:hypothetical protein